MKNVVYELLKPAPFGYETSEIFGLDFLDIARSVAKFDMTSVVSAAHRGAKLGTLSELNFETLGEHELAHRYDRALLHTLYEMTTDNPWYGVGHILGTHARFVQDERPSGVDWRSPVSAREGLDNREDVWQDLHIDVARRLGWVGLNGKTPIEHVAALYYRGFSGDRIYQLLHYKRFKGMSVDDAVKRIVGRVDSRQITYADPDMDASSGYIVRAGSAFDLACLEVDEPMFTEYWTRECPKWPEGRAINNGAIRKLGYVGVSGIDMFFAELQHGFARIDAVEL